VFVESLFEAARVYFQSKNISVFSLEDFVKIVRFAVYRHTASSSDVYNALSSQLRCSSRGRFWVPVPSLAPRRTRG